MPRLGHLDGAEIAPKAAPGHRNLPTKPVRGAAKAGLRRFAPAPAKSGFAVPGAKSKPAQKKEE
jgi:hypothetical protein